MYIPCGNHPFQLQHVTNYQVHVVLDSCNSKLQKHSWLSSFHLHVAILAQVLKEVAAFEVFVRVHNSLQLIRGHNTLVLGFLDFLLVEVLEYAIRGQHRIQNGKTSIWRRIVIDLPIAGHVVLLVILVLFDALERRSIRDTHSLHQCSEVFHIEVPVRAPVSFSWAGRMLCENLLAAEWAVTTATAIRVTTNVAVHVADIVLVLFVELVIINLVETSPPEE
jgi:hypothetical protein